MSGETVEAKARRLLADGRVRLHQVTGQSVLASVTPTKQSTHPPEGDMK